MGVCGGDTKCSAWTLMGMYGPKIKCLLEKYVTWFLVAGEGQSHKIQTQSS